MNAEVIHGDALEVLRGMEAESVDCCVTSPPYWSLRDYGVDGQLGLEPHPALYLEKLWAIFDEAQRVLKKTGVCFVNLGDSFAASSAPPQAEAPHPRPLRYRDAGAGVAVAQRRGVD